MNITFKIVSLEEAVANKYPNTEQFTDDKTGKVNDYKEYNYGIFRFENDKPVEFIGCDGGEPEDQLLCRDWSWVVEELTAAYQLGLNARK